MKKFISAMVAMCVMAVSLTGCFGSSETVKTLVVYTNQTTGGRSVELEDLVDEAGFDFDVTFVEIAGQTLKNRLVNEKASPIADVVLGGGLVEHMELKEEGVTAPYKPSWYDLVSHQLHDDEEYYYIPWSVEPLYIAYNKASYTTDPAEVTSIIQLAPTSYEDLADNFTGKYNIFKSSSASGSTIYASILSKYRDENGTYNISDEGWAVLDKLIDGGIMDAGLWQSNLAGRQYPISMTWAGAILDIESVYSVELGIVEQEGGVPANITQIAIVDSKSDARMDAAKEFVEWWGTTETQVAWASVSGQAPISTEAYELVDDYIKTINDAELMEMDWDFIYENLSDWITYIELSII